MGPSVAILRNKYVSPDCIGTHSKVGGKGVLLKYVGAGFTKILHNIRGKIHWLLPNMTISD